MTGSLDGAVVLVAGADGGIGSAVVQAARHQGAEVVAIARRDIDIAVPGGADEAVAVALEAQGRLDGIVHAVGMSGRRLGDGAITECTDEAWSEVHRVNYDSVFRLLRAGLGPLSRSPRGSAVVIGSALAHTLDDDFLTVAYSSAKAALVQLVRSAAYSVAPSGTRVNLLSPGLVDTPMATRALQDERIQARMPELHPLGARASTADEVAQAAVWLLGEESARITGAVVPADGGWHLH